MKLRELLENRAQIRVKEYERWGDDLIYVGGFYSLGMELNAWEWKNDNTLMIVR